MRLIDLSHDFTDGTSGFSLRRDGEVRRFTATVRPFLTHAQSAPYYEGQAEFEITEITFQTSIGTYLDSPFHRWKERLEQLPVAGFRFFAVPVKAVGAAAMTVRAFAEVA